VGSGRFRDFVIKGGGKRSDRRDGSATPFGGWLGLASGSLRQKKSRTKVFIVSTKERGVYVGSGRMLENLCAARSPKLDRPRESAANVMHATTMLRRILRNGPYGSSHAVHLTHYKRKG
jgi:hypothetical protein